jgi:hypothetical protein
MAAPRFSPVPSAEEVRVYESPEHVPDSWTPTRPTDIEGRQPAGAQLGYQGPGQGYVMTLAAIMKAHVQVQPGENIDDALKGCSLVALRRASLYGRAPVIHDLKIALTIWGFLDENPPADLVATRRPLFEGVRNTLHHYGDGREIADLVPEQTLRMTPEAVAAQMPTAWKELTGAQQ